MSVKWASTYCQNAQFLLKVDDDVLVNVHYLSQYLQNLVESHLHTNNTLLCIKHLQAEVSRNTSSKFFVSKEEYYDETYPVYCDGPAYLMTNDLARPLYESSLETPPFVWEDVYIGMLAKKLNSTFVNIQNAYITRKNKPFYSLLRADVKRTFFIYLKKADDFFPTWGQLLRKFYKRILNVYLI
jgi:hypothetical protein